MDRSEKVERYYNEDHHYKDAISFLRELALSTAVEENVQVAVSHLYR